MAEKGSAVWLFVFSFVLGFGTTIAEPALLAVAEEAARVAVGAGVIEDTPEALERYATGLRLVVALSVGVALLLGVLRILANWSLPIMIIGGYILVMVVTAVAPPEIVGVAYDSGGVTTSTVTVPLVTALALSVEITAEVVCQRRQGGAVARLVGDPHGGAFPLELPIRGHGTTGDGTRRRAGQFAERS